MTQLDTQKYAQITWVARMGSYLLEWMPEATLKPYAAEMLKKALPSMTHSTSSGKPWKKNTSLDIILLSDDQGIDLVLSLSLLIHLNPVLMEFTTGKAKKEQEKILPTLLCCYVDNNL